MKKWFKSLCQDGNGNIACSMLSYGDSVSRNFGKFKLSDSKWLKLDLKTFGGMNRLTDYVYG